MCGIAGIDGRGGRLELKIKHRRIDKARVGKEIIRAGHRRGVTEAV
jgi:hypothetical protein